MLAEHKVIATMSGALIIVPTSEFARVVVVHTIDRLVSTTLHAAHRAGTWSWLSANLHHWGDDPWTIHTPNRLRLNLAFPALWIMR